MYIGITVTTLALFFVPLILSALPDPEYERRRAQNRAMAEYYRKKAMLAWELELRNDGRAWFIEHMQEWINR